MINKGVNIYCKNKKGEDPLKLSIKKGNDEMFNIILNYMNKLKSESPEGKRQLMEEKLIKACKEGDINYLKETLNKSEIDINYKYTTYLGYTALHIASENGKEEMVKELLKYPNIDVDARSYKNNKEAVLFAPYHVDYTPLHLAVQKKHVAITELLLKNGADVNARISLLSEKYYDYTPLCFACEIGDEEIVKVLLNYHADVNYQISQKAKKMKGYTPLHFAVEIDSNYILQLLIEKGAYINANTAEYKQTPLMFACIIGCYDIVVTLVKNGADINIRDELKNTALGWAKNYKNESFNMRKEEKFLKIIKFLSE